MTEKDPTNPSYYAGEKCQCINAMLQQFGVDKVQDFCLLNAFKYLWRCTKKYETPYEDITKAQWYLAEWCRLEEFNVQQS